ncbi:hypothetical protein PHMEG_00010184 [Phytophthora megakarya]|uniref:Uncharacterized protein n=1 Tax=Phytophthora megakarya TaxID=4795 RepID=A0A225WG29_9STRA|nr:hypothetical protein PHMEG_00010184 [Phytophthora megakarya]
MVGHKHPVDLPFWQAQIPHFVIRRTINRNITAYFFEGLGDSLFRCKIWGTVRKQTSGTGHSNLIGHFAAKHDDNQAVYDTATTSLSLGTSDFLSETISSRFQWMRWIVSRNLPVAEVDNDLTTAMCCCKPISSKTLKKLMEYVTIKVGNALENELGDMFGLIFDGWSHVSFHYVGIFALYECNGQRRQPLLDVSPLDAGCQGAGAQIHLIANVLSVYNKTLEMVGLLVTDNCAKNQSIASKLMLRLVKRNVTRWSSTFAMVERYVQTRDEIKTWKLWKSSSKWKQAPQAS